VRRGVIRVEDESAVIGGEGIIGLACALEGSGVVVEQPRVVGLSGDPVVIVTFRSICR
jgi:hypothetical protein